MSESPPPPPGPQYRLHNEKVRKYYNDLKHYDYDCTFDEKQDGKQIYTSLYY